MTESPPLLVGYVHRLVVFGALVLLLVACDSTVENAPDPTARAATTTSAPPVFDGATSAGEADRFSLAGSGWVESIAISSEGRLESVTLREGTPPDGFDGSPVHGPCIDLSSVDCGAFFATDQSGRPAFVQLIDASETRPHLVETHALEIVLVEPRHVVLPSGLMLRLGDTVSRSRAEARDPDAAGVAFWIDPVTGLVTELELFYEM